jgi:hypothetical protein
VIGLVVFRVRVVCRRTAAAAAMRSERRPGYNIDDGVSIIYFVGYVPCATGTQETVAMDERSLWRPI